MRGKMKKIKIYNELVYVAAMLLLTLAVAMTAAADLGVSMVVGPAYILHLYFPSVTFGTFTYIVEGGIFILFCVLMKRVKLIYFGAFLTSVLYGFLLDGWRAVVPLFNASVTPPGSMAMWARMLLFAGGMLLTGFSVALFFRTYIPPQVVDMFVKGVSEKYGVNRTRFKLGTDAVLLILSVALTLIFFGKIEGIGVGTVIIALLNGYIIGFFGKMIDKLCIIVPILKKAEEKCRL